MADLEIEITVVLAISIIFGAVGIYLAIRQKYRK